MAIVVVTLTGVSVGGNWNLGTDPGSVTIVRTGDTQKRKSRKRRRRKKKKRRSQLIGRR